MLIMIAGVLYFAMIIAAATMMKKALASLSDADKIALVNMAARTPLVGFMLMAAVLAAWGFIIATRRDLAIPATVVILALVIISTAASSINAYRKYQRAALDQRFLRTFALSRTMRIGGAAIFFSTVSAWLLHAASAAGL